MSCAVFQHGLLNFTKKSFKKSGGQAFLLQLQIFVHLFDYFQMDLLDKKADIKNKK